LVAAARASARAKSSAAVSRNECRILDMFLWTEFSAPPRYALRANRENCAYTPPSAFSFLPFF
jgi:hypothetical protein